MATAEIITIGTELLLGEIVNTNSQYLAKSLNDQGFDVFRVTTVGDNVSRIADILKEASLRSDLVITTGGLGPTIDDPTREAAALACGVPTVFHEELWAQIVQRFAQLNRTPSENNKRQAYLPQNATAIENQVGTAPAFFLHTGGTLLCCLPGVPSEMRFIFEKEIIPIINHEIPTHAVLITIILHTIGIGESSIDQLIGDLEKMQNPTIGLAAHMGRVDIRISAKADTEKNAHKMMQPILFQIKQKLEPFIYGYNGESIEDAVIQQLSENHVVLNYQNSEQAPFLAGIVSEIQTKLENKIGKNQYNNKKLHELILTTSILELDQKKTLLVTLEQAGKKTSQEYNFLNDTSAFEGWVINRTLGTIFSYLKRKG